MQLVLLGIAVISLIVAILGLIFDLDFAIVLSFLAALSTLIGYLATRKPKGKTETLDQRNRRVMLNHVENFWIKGVLEKSLHGVALLELGIKEEPGAVSYPWTIKKQSTNEILPAGKSMLEIFGEIGMGRSLLILGAPGSGKTTMLLELARQLIQSARQDEKEPIPVVFNLAAWTERLPLAQWLAQQLSLIYYVPKKVAPTWITENRMLLLLDGLDEVEEHSRAKCVQAINQFRTNQGLTSMVICSRLGEYKTIGAKLSFEGAITLQPLSPEQIDNYVDRFGNSLAGVRLLLKKDQALEELAETPLMLSIMVLAYKDRNPNDMIVSGSRESNRKHLFHNYIERMFERSTRKVQVAFSQGQTLNYLHLLAVMMAKHNIVTYHIEMMQPSWLPHKSHNYLYVGFTGLIGGLISGTMIGSVASMFADLNAALMVGMLMGLISVLAFGTLSAFSREIRILDIFQWSWQRVLFVLLAWMIIGPISWLIWRDPSVLFGSLLLTTILGGINEGQTEETTYPGDRLKKNFYNTFLFAMLILVLSLLNGLLFNRSILEVVATALLFGPVIGLILVGTGIIEHFALRLVLAWYGILPWRLITVLDYAVNLIFLRRVGGSYIFVHRLLMEHFAEMEIPPDKPRT